MQVILKSVLLMHLLHEILITVSEAKCGKPGQSWNENNLILMNPDKSTYSLNESVTYSCTGRIYVNDDKRSERMAKSSKGKTTKQYMRSCQTNGQWSGAVPKCGKYS